MHQECYYSERVSGTESLNPDTAAPAHGLHGEVVTTSSEFSQAFERCLETSRPSLIDGQSSP
ncbi:thiamine pyrophosphate-dependent enzyme [Pseudomonas syringae]|uniref:thiamine pyrophosphate-dependent enzyme n=1 Tax=Pseudomonas syringae TaxID=317 RepID=UPI002E2EB5C8|nr:thiamine pyrophosphate-dependent enzyme [Pseudomonas syringae]